MSDLPKPTAEQEKMLQAVIEAAIPELRQSLIMVLSGRAGCDHFEIAKFSNKTPAFQGKIHCFITDKPTALIVEGTLTGIEQVHNWLVDQQKEATARAVREATK